MGWVGMALQSQGPYPTLHAHLPVYLQADKGVRVAIGIHGGEVGAAQHPHQQAATLGAVAQGQQDAPTLLPKHLRLHLLLQVQAVVRPCPAEARSPSEHKWLQRNQAVKLLP